VLLFAAAIIHVLGRAMGITYASARTDEDWHPIVRPVLHVRGAQRPSRPVFSAQLGRPVIFLKNLSALRSPANFAPLYKIIVNRAAWREEANEADGSHEICSTLPRLQEYDLSHALITIPPRERQGGLSRGALFRKYPPRIPGT